MLGGRWQWRSTLRGWWSRCPRSRCMLPMRLCRPNWWYRTLWRINEKNIYLVIVNGLIGRLFARMDPVIRPYICQHIVYEAQAARQVWVTPSITSPMFVSIDPTVKFHSVAKDNLLQLYMRVFWEYERFSASQSLVSSSLCCCKVYHQIFTLAFCNYQASANEQALSEIDQVKCGRNVGHKCFRINAISNECMWCFSLVNVHVFAWIPFTVGHECSLRLENTLIYSLIWYYELRPR
jgi:hypothetical protein